MAMTKAAIAIATRPAADICLRPAREIKRIAPQTNAIGYQSAFFIDVSLVTFCGLICRVVSALRVEIHCTPSAQLQTTCHTGQVLKWPYYWVIRALATGRATAGIHVDASV